MKKAALILSLTFSFLLLKAQTINSWNNFNGKLYGTEQEYQKQIGIRDKAGYELYQLLGYKSYFTNGLTAYLQQTKGYTLKSSESKSCITYTLTGKEDKSDKVILKFWINEEDRITKAKFYGNKDRLSNLFLSYWPTAEKETSEGAVAEKKFLNERIVFNYSGNKPYIEVIN